MWIESRWECVCVRRVTCVLCVYQQELLCGSTWTIAHNGGLCSVSIVGVKIDIVGVLWRERRSTSTMLAIASLNGGCSSQFWHTILWGKFCSFIIRTGHFRKMECPRSKIIMPINLAHQILQIMVGLTLWSHFFPQMVYYKHAICCTCTVQAQRKRLGYLVGNLVATKLAHRRKHVHAVGCN